jgi:leucyl-tRNA synthetase
MPVDCYVGGAEHAVMHLLYARFWTKVLFDEGIVPCNEPFAKLQNQGMLLAPTPFRHALPGESLKVGEEGVQLTYDVAAKMRESEVFWRWEKMSKSKGNVVTPDEAVEKYGADALRVYELFEAPFESTIQWSEDRVNGAINFLHRVFKLLEDFRPSFRQDWREAMPTATLTPEERAVRRATHKTISKVTDDIEEFKFNTAVAALMEYRNALGDFVRESGSGSDSSAIVMSEAAETLVLLLSPITPHSADEIAEAYGIGDSFLYRSQWPAADPTLAEDEIVTIVIQVNGKLRDSLAVTPGRSNEELERLALDSEKVKALIAGLSVRKVIVVPDKVVNIVAG